MRKNSKPTPDNPLACAPSPHKAVLLFCFLFFLAYPFFPVGAAPQPRRKAPNKRGLPVGFVPPKLKRFVQAPYPAKAKQQKVTGSVVILLIVDTKGNVAKATVLQKGGHGFDEAALAAVKKFKFIPATFKGKPVPVKISYRYHFVLRTKKRRPPVKPRPRSRRKAPISVRKRAPTSRETSQPTSQKAQTHPASKAAQAPSSRAVIQPGLRVVDGAKKPKKRQPQPVTRQTRLSPARPRSPSRRVASPSQKNRKEWAGLVRERGTRDPIEGATVYILGRRYRSETATDQYGRYSFKNVPAGKYRIVIPVPNYKKFERILRLKKGVKRSVAIWYLRKVSDGQFQSISRARRKRREIYKKSIQREELEIIPGTQGDPLKVIQNLPGVARTPLNTGFFIVRGSAPEDSRVYIDGHQIPALYHFGGLTAVVNADITKGIDLLPGGFSVAYGRATGGVIVVKTRKGKSNWHGYLDVDLIDLGFFLEGPLWKGATLMISARRSHMDFFLGMILPEIPAFDLTVAPRYYDYQIKLDWQMSKKHNLSLMYFGSRDLLTFLRSAPIGGTLRGEFGFYSMFHRIQLRWRFTPSKSVTHDFSMNAGFSLNDVKAGTTIGFANQTWIIAIRDELRWNLLKNLSLRGGLDVRLRQISLDVRLPTSVPREGDLPGSQGNNPLGNISALKNQSWVAEPAAYLELNWEIAPSLRAQAGLRFDYYTSSKDFTLDPRLNLTWKTPWKPLSFAAGVGLFSQAPQLQESSEVFGNPDVKAEHAVHLTLAANYRWTRYFNTEAIFFYKHMYNLIVRSNKTVQRGGKNVPERLRNGGTGRAYGGEFLIRYKPYKKFFGWISYTISRSERQDNPGDPYRLFSFDQSHIFTFVAAYKVGWGLSVSARFRLVSGNPATPIRGGIFDADRGNYIPIPGKNHSIRNPLFHQLDLRVDYKLTFNTWKLMFYLDVQNVYNQANQEGITYNYDYSKSAPLVGVPIFPSFGIKGEF